MTPTVRLVQFTDTHLFGDAAEDLRGVATLPALRATLEQAADDILSADAILVTGDLVQDDARGYGPFREAFAQLGRPVLCLPGNHDDPRALARALSASPFQVCGHADLAAWRLVLLDSVKPGAAAGRLSEAELRRLDSALADAGDRHALVCLHHHPVRMGSAWLDEVGLENPAEFFAVIDRHPRVRGVLWGHVHQQFEALRDGVRLLSTPSTCAQFLPGSDDFRIDPRPPAYRILSLNADGSIGTEVVWLDRLSSNRQTSSASAG